jgi:FHS family Na+ dependent glucose MFS transporter 1
MEKQKIPSTVLYYTSFIAMGISMAAIGPTLTDLAVATQASLGEISILFTARSLGSLIGSVGGGRIYDRMPGHRLMAAMILGMAFLSALVPFMPMLWLLTAVLFFTGMVQGILNIGGNTLLVWTHGDNVGPFMNGLHFFFGVGTLVAPVIVAQMVLHGGSLASIYLLLAVIILPSAAVAFVTSPKPPHVENISERSGNNNLALIVLIGAVFGCYSGASTAFGGWVYTYAVKMRLADATLAAYLTSIFWGALTVGRLVAIPIAMRFKPQAILWADFAGALLSLVAMFLWPQSLAAVIVTSAGFGFALASIYPTTMSLAGRLMPISGRVTGLFSIGNSAGMMLIPWIIGQFFEGAPQSMTAILLIDMAVALAVLFVLSRVTAPNKVVKTAEAG